MKKPKSSVSIVPLSKMVERHADLFACPLARIINKVRRGEGWPELWKEQEVTVIPKSTMADSYTACRNISCTSVFSKLCEAYMLDDLTDEVKLSNAQ